MDREPRLSPGLLRTDRKKDETSTSNMLSAEVLRACVCACLFARISILLTLSHQEKTILSVPSILSFPPASPLRTQTAGRGGPPSLSRGRPTASARPESALSSTSRRRGLRRDSSFPLFLWTPILQEPAAFTPQTSSTSSRHRSGAGRGEEES